MTANELHKKLFNEYDNYYQTGFESRYITPDKLKETISRQATGRTLTAGLLGESFEGREIFSITAGKGKINILLWSQMHGDESTATRALFDVFAFLNADNDGYEAVRQTILQNFSLCFVPMLNPDGAMRWQRRTAQYIDMNRDALRNITVEGQLLQNIFKSIKPTYAFNLHDQASYYSAGATANPATISLLAPSVDDKDTIPEKRYRSMQLVCFFNNVLQQYIPGCVGKWKDNYEPRAFGEHFQSLGAATVLIESGGRKNDLERNLARKLNFILLISAFYAIATNSIQQEDISNYKQIPVNFKEGIFDIIYKNAILKQNDKEYTCDIGVRRSEKLNVNGELTSSFIIEDIGDLSPFGAFETIDVKSKIVNKNDIPIMIGNEVYLEILS
ncbi:MAG: hypothetical protein LBL90_05580 [Prevotellaceae bacterium]|jgi:hypothetical protein|nr:hypothetical protein [Prevotellaceae bacterium]